MAENRRDRDKRIYFSRAQLVLLGGAFTLTALVIFLRGIVVGRGIEERKVARPEEPLIKIPVKPSGQGGATAPNGQAKEELTFYDTLTKPTGAESSLEEKISEPNPIEKATKPEPKESKSRRREEQSPGILRTEQKPPSEKLDTAQASGTADEKESGKTWYVQVNAFPDEQSGKIWVDRLKNKGYNA